MTPSSPPATPAAVTAFLRGVDRRARLLARVQAGDEEAARRALAVATRVFAGDAAGWPMSQWPLQFWRLLLSVPAMGRGVARPAAGPLPGIARLPPPARAAVLLHLVAGLEDADAAAALDLPVAAYQGRIRDALPRDALGQPDLDVWRAWSAAVKRTLDALPDTAPTPLEAALPAPATADHTARRRLRWLWLGVLLCALALAATYLLQPGTRAAIDAWRQRVQVQSLPPADPPKARFDPADPALQPDRALLLAPRELALARRLPLLAWLAADAAALPPADPAADPAVAPAAIDLPPDAAELARRTQAWERLAPAARAQARAAWADWQALPESERTQLRAIAAHFDALPAPEQQALQARYAQQPFDAHRGWHLGPRLGRDWPRIAPLFAFVDAGERAALLQLLRELSGDDLEALARLAQTTPPQARATLRRTLLAEPPTRRSAWLQAQLQR
ncbi:DUF3106 domain-containing protein [Thermomonas haemolytica]|uniref:Uncharacterized protein DUF3106 n=1 Tax=Thermomonas haemolytica TaxID=141949 RepID=A0A4R3N0J2_9GAMM|nr:DUF3106 domain-containing protein [Thermomonas haemolytica]TCT21677.1 uncharacterized protein DUF3106 [Thermomonas haemolytica]TNY30197.1 hypothetical protein BV505_00855 [Thermomonas haemolytica]